MNQQRFETYRADDAVMLRSWYGNKWDDIAIPAGVELEFRIFHGRGGQNFKFWIGLLLDGDAQPMAARAPTGLDFESHAGFSWQLPLSPGLTIDPTRPPDFPGGAGGSAYTREGLTVRLYRPGEGAPIHEWDFNNEFMRGEREFSFPVTQADGNVIFVNPEAMRRFGWWRVVVSHKSPRAAHILFGSTSHLQQADVRTTKVTYRWLNHAFWNVLEALTPRAIVEGNRISVGIAEEAARAVGSEGFSHTATFDGLDGYSELKSISATAMNGAGMKADLLLSLQAESSHMSAAKLQSCKQKVAVLDDAMLVIKLEAAFTDPHFSFSKLIVSGDLVFKRPPVIYLGFSQTNSYPWCYVNLHYSVRNLGATETVLFKLAAEDKYELITHLNQEVMKAIIDNYAIIRTYFNKALGRAAGKNAVIDKFRGVADGWELDYYEFTMPDINYDPSTSPQVHNVVSPDVAATIWHAGGSSNANTGDAILELENVDVPSAVADPGYGVFPQGFYVPNGVPLDRLDRIKTIFVIMMENRSFDHFLGFLRNEPPPSNGGAYVTFPSDFTNPGAGNFVGPLRPIKASQIGFANVLVTPISPEHEYDHVIKQISDGLGTRSKIGKMQGFTINIMERFGETEIRRFESPQMVMTYYGKSELPTYHFLASQFMVLDQWFCAHPGPTWPNRIATLTGHLVDLRNLSLTKDKRIGYLRDSTVFETLSRYGIDWLYMESNASIMRLFDLYRTDDTHVVPLRERDAHALTENGVADHYLSGLELLLKRSQLPRVVFIEPRFSDAPPLMKAFDDLAPTNIGSGQGFIRDACDLLLKSSHWNESALLVTYDEHGGFFDHVPPPGTQAEPEPPVPPDIPDWKKYGVPRIHPDPESPTFLGVRVPTMLVSPFVSGRSVCHTVFDHTSILKTILVHNRTKIPRDAFGLFGERVNQATHIGVAFDLDVPREAPRIPSELPSLLSNASFATEPSGIASFHARRDPAEISDFHEALRTVFMPR